MTSLLPGSRRRFTQSPALATRQNFGVAQKFQTCLSRVIHHNESHAVITRQIPRADVLLIAPVVRKGNPLGVNNLHEPFASTPVLHVGPSGCAYRGHVEGVSLGDESGFVSTKTIR